MQELNGQVWVASRSDPGDTLLGAWPGLAERPDIRYVVRDWLAKLQIVAAGLAITTLAPIALDVLPDGVTAVAVRGEPQETRRVVLARRPGPLDGATARVADALVAAAAGEPRASVWHSGVVTDHEYDIQLDDKFGSLTLIDLPAQIAAHEPWHNETIATVNDAVVRLGVIEGDFHWHKHDQEDEFFLVLEGQLLIDLEDRETVALDPHQGFTVPAA